jgi:predicted nucleotidyltransferase
MGLFGPIVREDLTVNSDVDIIADFSQLVGIKFIDLANLIEERIGKPVDLVSKNGGKLRYYKEIAPEIIYA